MAPKWPTGSGTGSTPRFSGAPINFGKIRFFYISTPYLGNIYDGEKKGKKKKKRENSGAITSLPVVHLSGD